ncbi:hypothetical protein OPQ81_001224 [Rhizoctonia solani]|nr:hypothetical protein OPQ81_001224 [Rhizoctonia solani]
MGRYTYSISSPLSPSDQEIIAAIVRVESEPDLTPPGVYITSDLVGHHEALLSLTGQCHVPSSYWTPWFKLGVSPAYVLIAIFPVLNLPRPCR